MNALRTLLAALGAAAVLAAAPSLPARGADAGTGAWRPPTAEAVQAQVTALLAERKADDAAKAKAAEIWAAQPAPPRGLDLLNRTVKTLALADANVAKLVEFCSRPRGNAMPPAQPWLADEKAPPLLTKNVRLWYGRWMVHEALYDEALEQLNGLQIENVVDPASLLFYRAVAHYRLLDKDAGIESIAQLLEEPDLGPRRYVTIARLLEADLKDLKEDSLDHIARRMDDIERRLDLGRGGKKVRRVQDGVIESLDKLIKELEDQQQQGGGGSGNNIQSSSPAQDSQLMGGKGKGDVDRKRIGSGSGWGDLPPKQREEALQQIGREFPAHYRDVIEQYFRKLASEGSE